MLVSDLMRFLVIIIVSSILLAIVVDATTPQGKSELLSRKEQTRPRLELTTSLLSSKYCKGDADVDTMSIRLELRFRNNGQQSLILRRNAKLIFREFISKDSESARIGAHEAELTFDFIEPPKKLGKITKNTLRKHFVTLGPNEVYRTITGTNIMVRRNNEPEIGGTVTAGHHVLQVSVYTWHESQEIAARLRRRWQSIGFLWSESVTSKTMEFVIDAQRSPADCK